MRSRYGLFLEQKEKKNYVIPVLFMLKFPSTFSKQLETLAVDTLHTLYSTALSHTIFSRVQCTKIKRTVNQCKVIFFLRRRR